jgi:hypothetical protein
MIMTSESGTKLVLPAWGSLVLTFALLFLTLLLMASLAQAGYPGQVAAGPRAAAAVAQQPAGARLPGLQASLTITDPVTRTALLPLVMRGYTPPPWIGAITDRYQNCFLTRLFGFTLDQEGEPVGDVWVHYWANEDTTFWTKSSWEPFGSGPDDSGNWDGVLDSRPRSVVWYACVVPEKRSWDCESNVVEAETSANCNKGYQVIAIDFRQR